MGTPGYIAPEIFNNNIHMNGDIFSAGVILFSLLTGIFPYNAENNDEIYKKNREAIIFFKHNVWCKISKAAKNLV